MHTLEATDSTKQLFGNSSSENLKQAKVIGQDVDVLTKKPQKTLQKTKNSNVLLRRRETHQSSTSSGYKKSTRTPSTSTFRKPQQHHQSLIAEKRRAPRGRSLLETINRNLRSSIILLREMGNLKLRSHDFIMDQRL